MDAEHLAAGVFALDFVLLLGAVATLWGVLDLSPAFWGHTAELFAVLTAIAGTLLMLTVEE